MCVFMGVVHRVDMFIWVFKSDLVLFLLMVRNSSLRRSCVGRINIFLKSLVSDTVLWLL